LGLGRTRFGPPKVAINKKINAIAGCHRLKQMVDRVLAAKSCDEVIALPCLK
jgi:hypothetical protein